MKFTGRAENRLYFIALTKCVNSMNYAFIFRKGRLGNK